MALTPLEFAPEVAALTTNALSLLLALALVRLIESKMHAVLIVINLWLLMEIAAVMIDPSYRFASLWLERLTAVAVQVALVYWIVVWRHRKRVDSQSIAAH